ncbi:MAG: hypothetical protein LBC41_18175 [Clostridiales bacterium]|jgi:hypothetical protein|nr:hypothetical protein [Clostridiales bacterium]MDR2752587.1 hypothetical protein [Clostridiales bacterium]
MIKRIASFLLMLTLVAIAVPAYANGEVGNEESKYRALRIIGAANVEIYEDGKLALKITGEAIDGKITAYLDGAEKYAFIPPSANYDVKITTTGDGILSYLVTEEDYGGGKAARAILYNQVKVSKGETYTGTLPKYSAADYNLTRKGTSLAYTLVSPSGTAIRPYMDGDIDGITFIVEAFSNDETLGSVIPRSKGLYMGQIAVVTAYMADGAEFDGWYEKGKKIEGAGDVYEFSIQTDRELVAHFKGQSMVGPTPVERKTVSPAEALNRLGLLVGTGTGADGKPDYGLDKSLTRLEALALVIRMMGLEKESQAYKGANPFVDVPAWGVNYAAYGYDIKITAGVDPSKGLFAPDRPVTFQEFTAFMLRVLGYHEANGDFAFADAQAKAEDIRMFSAHSLDEVNNGTFLRGNAVMELVDALLTSPKGSSDQQIVVLSGKGVFSKADATWFLDNAI